ncbi:hypothetical protein FOB58_002308 [Candida parapsilosis]|uniref:Uncharacterized protein n=2 Tax=Candida parapsilosis TaxID=5480 RepID=G8BBD1_CANPC|nr:uncharacterized protein CPAR2_809040 [Candida parapsilosis]KAF6052248.1 hypothetical protein FOB58_002308 [Candida parapsilosis]KAF6052255.1 hypothetical protein FOB60_002511 [Candida parapsilosis]KAF6054050.1 hypothetical protein FOB59_002332 [Candida parapsilosis]KAF6064031.1 hypothetical protein FOB61_002457 [Candida parapsilosis]KAI5902708.1 hypothetical protein K4G60_g1851 [Candida parapsilosis]
MSESAAVNSTATKKQPPQSRLKQLTSASTWVSPFRGQPDEEGAANSKKKVNLYKQFKEDNKVEHIKVPAKFAHHPTLEAEEKKKKKQAKSTKSTKPAKKTDDAKAKTKSTTTTTTDERVKSEEKKLDEEAKEKLIADEPTTEEQKLEEESKEKLIADEPTTEEQKLEEESKEKLITDESTTKEPADDSKNNLITGESTTKEPADELKDNLTTDQGLERKATNESRETLLKDEYQETSEPTGPAAEAKEDTEAAQADIEAANADIEDAKKVGQEQEDLAKNHLEGDDEIIDTIKEHPVDIPAPSQTKYEPVDRPNKEILEKLKDKPVLLRHYQELNATAVGSLAHDLDDPKKVIELGSGLRLTQEQLLDMAAKRVAPVITSINDEVSKTRQEDEIKRQQLLDQKVKKHEGKLKTDFDKYAAKVNKRKEVVDQEIERKLTNIANLVKTSDENANKFEKKTRGEIETAAKEYEERETQAAEKHVTDKETLEKNHEELLATKKQELEDSKEGQEKATQEIEDLKQKKIDLTEKNSELDTEIERLKKRLEEEKAKLQDLTSQHESHQEAIETNQGQSKELNEKIGGYQKDIDDRKTTHKGLVAEVGALGALLGAFAAKLSDVNSDKADRPNRLTEAKNKHSAWQKEKDQLAEEAAREHERQRAIATQEYETRKHQEELERKREKEEQERLEREEQERQAKLEEEERRKQAQLEAEEKERQARLEEEERQRKAEEEAKAKELKEKEEKQAAVAEKLKSKEAKQRNLEEERNRHDSLYQKGSYTGGESEYHEAQKERLGDEITNLQKIKELREERATYTGEDPKSDELDKLIKERQKAIKKIENKQAQPSLNERAVAEEPTSSKNLVTSGTGAAAGTVFGQDLINEQSKLPSAQENPGADYDLKKKGAIHDEDKSVPNFERNEDEIKKKEPEEKKSGLGSAIVTGGAAGAGTGAAVGAATSSSNSATPLTKERSNSLSDRFKGWGRRLSRTSTEKSKEPAEKPVEKPVSKDVKKENVVGGVTKEPKPFSRNENTIGGLGVAPKGNDTVGGLNANDTENKTGFARVVPKENQTVVGGVNANDIESKDYHRPGAAIAAGASEPRRDDASWEVQSVYELISDGEYEANKNDPNYFAVNEEEYKKHKEKEKKVTLLDKIF